MLTRRNFFVILIMFLVVFLMFMLVDLSTAYLTRHEYNPQADIPVTIQAEETFSIGMLDAASVSQGALSEAIQAYPVVAIMTEDPASVNVQNIQEWCLYNRYRYQVYTELPEATQLEGYRAILFDTPVSDVARLPLLQDYAALGIDMIFTQLPEYQALQAAPELADFYGIEGFVQEAMPIKGLYIFDEFFIGGERIYAVDDIYGDSDDDIPRTVANYTLRPGYLMFIQAVAQDETVDYMELPGLVWRTHTGNSNVFAVNTDLFAGKNLPGLLTACLSQTGAFYVYPVVNAQTISVVDFPMLADENGTVMASLYSRSAEALGRDVLWPAIVKILKNYSSAFNFFMAPQLDYSDAVQPSGELISFYRTEIESQSGMLGLSMQQESAVSFDELCRQNDAFLQAAMPAYRFTAACVTRDQLTGISAQNELPAPLSSTTLLMTDLQEDRPLMEFVNDRVLAVSFTTDGYRHESMDDLRLMCIENALGMNNQKVEMSRAFYPRNNEDWNTLNLLWSRGDTFQKPYHTFDTLTAYGMEERVRTFLALDFEAGMQDNVLTLRVKNGVKNTSFVLRLLNHEIQSVKGGKCKVLSDTAYLLQPAGEQMELQLRPLHVIDDAPDTYQEVIAQ